MRLKIKTAFRADPAFSENSSTVSLRRVLSTGKINTYLITAGVHVLFVVFQIVLTFRVVMDLFSRFSLRVLPFLLETRFLMKKDSRITLAWKIIKRLQILDRWLEAGTELQSSSMPLLHKIIVHAATSYLIVAKNSLMKTKWYTLLRKNDPTSFLKKVKRKHNLAMNHISERKDTGKTVNRLYPRLEKYLHLLGIKTYLGREQHRRQRIGNLVR